MNGINPYRRNCEIMRKFFAKPIFLVSGIVSLIFNFYDLVIFLIYSNRTFHAVSCALGIAFLMLFFTARSKKEAVSFKAPIVIMEIASVVSIVFLTLAALFFGFLSVFLLIQTPPEHIEYTGYEAFFASLADALRTALTVISPIITVLSVVLLLYFIAMEITVLSFKKSLSNIYLQKKGACALGVISVVMTVITTVCAALLFLIGMSFDFSAVLWLLPILMFFICTSIIGFGYNKYISGIAGNIETKAPQKEIRTPEKKGVDKSFPLELWDEAEKSYDNSGGNTTASKPIDFDFEVVFARPDEKTNKEDNVNQIDFGESSAEKVKKCKNCGRINPPKNIFCGSCGNKL